MSPFRPVIIESPYAGDVARNKAYLQRCIRDCIARGESPYASHQMLTDALDDTNPAEREQGIKAGFAWRAMSLYTVVYIDYGTSRGMQCGIEAAHEIQHPIEYRKIGTNPAPSDLTGLARREVGPGLEFDRDPGDEDK